MMNRTQFLLVKVAEEGIETAQRAMKASYFGLEQTQVGQPLDNRQRLFYEFNDLIAVMRMLGLRTEPDEEMVAKKIEKLNGYMALSVELGELEPQADLAGVKVAERDNYLGPRHLPDASQCEAYGKCSQAVPHS
jgi:hypothetical protein